ncbi:MAG TPA: hypothetical protein VGM51_13555, partial [Armatimonadota bacterium]
DRSTGHGGTNILGPSAGEIALQPSLVFDGSQAMECRLRGFRCSSALRWYDDARRTRGDTLQKTPT